MPDERDQPPLLDERGRAGLPLGIVLVTLVILGTLAAALLAAVTFYPQRHVALFRTKDRTGPALEVKQDRSSGS